MAGITARSTGYAFAISILSIARLTGGASQGAIARHGTGSTVGRASIAGDAVDGLLTIAVIAGFTHILTSGFINRAGETEGRTSYTASLVQPPTLIALRASTFIITVLACLLVHITITVATFDIIHIQSQVFFTRCTGSNCAILYSPTGFTFGGTL